MGAEGRVRVVLHSIAFGNLKLIGPEAPSNDFARQRLAEELGIDEAALGEAADKLFADGCDGVQGLTTAPGYSSSVFMEEEDIPILPEWEEQIKQLQEIKEADTGSVGEG